MAKARQQPQEPQEYKTVLLDDDTTSGESLAPALQALYSEMGVEGETEATVHVSLLPTDGKSVEAGVWKGDPGEYDLQTIARDHGSGSYRVKVYVRNEDGSKPCRANKIFAWKLTIAEERARKAAMNAAANPAPAAPPADALTAEKIAAMVTAGIAAAMPKMPSRKDMLEEMAMMAKMFQPASSDSFTTQLKNLSALTEVIRVISPPQQPRLLDDDGKVDNGAVIMKGLDVLGNAFAAAKSGAIPAPAPVAPAVIPAGMTVDGNGQLVPMEGATIQQNDEGEQAMLMLKLHLKTAVITAKAGGDPKEFADTVFPLLPDEAVALLQTDPQWMQKLVDINADVAKYPDWFKAVVAEILRLEAEDAKGGDAAS